jgi:hypothetical protein
VQTLNVEGPGIRDQGSWVRGQGSDPRSSLLET